MQFWQQCILCASLVLCILVTCNKGHEEDGVAAGLLPGSKAPWDSGEDDGGHHDEGSSHLDVQNNKNGDPYTVDLKMPGVRPTKEDEYLCTAFELAPESQNIINFEALATATVAHHMLLYGCSNPYLTTSTWQCGATCRGSSRIIFAWAKNAPPTAMPKDVGFKVGGDSGTRFLVLQVHYKHPLSISEEADRSGMRLTFTSHEQKYIAGIFILLRNSLYIPAHSEKTNGDVTCKYEGSTVLYPFGFRTHTHTLGKVVSGYHYNGKYQLLGKGNPQWPQAFYPVKEKQQINPGEYMVARCSYDSSDRSRATYIGSTHNDEMCNFYLMYYTDAKEGKNFYQCMQDGFPQLSRQMPEDADTPLPPNPALEEAAEGTVKAIQLVPNWPVITDGDQLTLGQVAGVATDSKGNVHIFHRATRVWDYSSFDSMNNYIGDTNFIPQNTLITFDKSGHVIKQWGSNRFLMPHGLHIDGDDNIWVTDVGLHQVFKFNPNSDTPEEPEIALGVARQPGKDEKHFCKPSDVVVLGTGEFFVSDGYCNSRIIKFSKSGDIIAFWGNRTTDVGDDGYPPPGAFDLPHSLTLLEDLEWICVADRLNARIQCFDYIGHFIKQIHPETFNGNVFAVAYSQPDGVLYAVNGPSVSNKRSSPSGFTFNPQTSALMNTWNPPQEFHKPHDIAVSSKGDYVYVAEIGPNKIWKFYVRQDVLDAATGHKTVKKGGVMSHPDAHDLGDNAEKVAEKIIEKKGDKESGDFGVSMVIGSLLVIPVLVIVFITIFMRCYKSDSPKSQGYRKANIVYGNSTDLTPSKLQERKTLLPEAENDEEPEV